MVQKRLHTKKPSAASALSLKSCLFDSGSSQYMSFTPTVGGDTTVLTVAVGVKRGTLGAAQQIIAVPSAPGNAGLSFTTDNKLEFYLYYSGGWVGYFKTTRVFRDSAGHYQIVLVIDTDNATQADRMRLYINGIRETVFDSETQVTTKGQTTTWNTNTTHYIGTFNAGSTPLDSYVSYLHILEQALDASYFGEFNADNQWRLKAFSGTFGSRDRLYAFDDSADMGADTSGNGLDATLNGGIDADSQLSDSPTDNYAVLNPLDEKSGAVSGGNLIYTGAASVYAAVAGSKTFMSDDTDGYYFEVSQTTYGQYSGVGLLDREYSISDVSTANAIGWTANANMGIAYMNNGALNNYGSTVGSPPTYTANTDVIGFFVRDNKVWIRKNSTWLSGDPDTDTSPSITLTGTKRFSPAINGNSSGVLELNCGQRDYAQTPPTGAKNLSSSDMDDPTVGNPATGMDVVTRDGTGAAATVTLDYMTGVDDGAVWWSKCRSVAEAHSFYDTIRGATKVLYPDYPDAEGTRATGLTAFNDDGASLGTAGEINGSGRTYVDWIFKIGAIYGVDLVRFSGTGSGTPTFSHSLGVVPEMAFVKSILSSANWAAGHVDAGWGNAGLLNGTNAFGTSSYFTNAPTASVFSVGDASVTNISGTNNMLALLFASIPQYSRVFSATLGTSSGFIPLDFRSRFTMLKNTSTGAWYLFDDKRLAYNPDNNALQANDSAVELTSDLIDIVSNGIVNRGLAAGTYIGYSVAAQSGKFALAR